MKPTHLRIEYTDGSVSHLQVTHETSWRQKYLLKIWSAQVNVKRAKLVSPNNLVPNPRY